VCLDLHATLHVGTASCINKIPEAIWSDDKQAFCFPNSKVQVVRGDPLDKSNKGLLVTHSIKKGEIVAVFGNTTAIDYGSPAGGAFNRIRNALLKCVDSPASAAIFCTRAG